MIGQSLYVVFFFQAEDGIRDKLVTGVQTCALPIYRPQRGRRVSREERVAGSRGEDHAAALFEVPDRAATDVVLADLLHADRGHDAGVAAERLERVLQGEAVHDGREHAHVVCRDAVHARPRQAGAAEDVAAADDDRDLDVAGHDFPDLPRDALQDGRIDAVVRGAEQRFAADLEQNPLERLTGLRIGHAPTLLRAPFYVQALPFAASTWAITSAAKFSCFFSMPSPTSKRRKPLTAAFDFSSNAPTLVSGSFTKGWPVRQISARYLRRRPSTIFSTMAAGLPSAAAWAARISRSLATTSPGTSAGDTYCGFTAATCMATSRASASSPPFMPTSTPMRVPCT